MPVPALKGLSEKYGCPMATLEKFWEEAKGEYGDDWEAVMGTVKKRAANWARGRRSRLEGKA